MKRDLSFERFYPHPPRRVWKALTDRAALSQWMMPTDDFEPIVGKQFMFVTDPAPTFDGKIYCEVVMVDEPVQLIYKFWSERLRETLVKWTLIPKDEGTLLQLEHTGFTGLSEIAISGIIGFGWRRMLSHTYLATVLDDLAKEERTE